jgi:hypothetical protein
MSITTGYANSAGTDLGSIFAVSSGGPQITNYKNSTNTDLGALFFNQTGGTTITGYKTSTGTDLGSLFALAPVASIYKTPLQAYGISIDPTLNLYCTNAATSSQITKITSDGTVSNFGASNILGYTNCIGGINTNLYVAVDGTKINIYLPGSPATAPTTITVSSFAIGVVADPSGNIFIANTSGYIICYKSGTITPALAIITPTGGTTYALSTSGVTTASNFKGEQFYAVTVYNGSLYATSQGGFIISMLLSEILTGTFNNANIKIYKFAGTGTNAVISAPIPYGTLATDSAIQNPRDIRFNNGYAYILEYSANMIKKVNMTTRRITLFASANSALLPILTTSLINAQTQCCIDSTNNIMYIANYLGGNILKITNV